MEDVEGQESDQKERLHGMGFMFEAMILDVPALVTERYDSSIGDLLERQE